MSKSIKDFTLELHAILKEYEYTGDAATLV